VNAAGSDETEVVRLLENATAEVVHIKRDAEENAREIMQDTTRAPAQQRGEARWCWREAGVV
jgi:hypothetical protein